MALGLPQTISDRTHQPSSCSAMASRLGIMQRSPGFNVPPATTRPDGRASSRTALASPLAPLLALWPIS